MGRHGIWDKQLNGSKETNCNNEANTWDIINLTNDGVKVMQYVVVNEWWCIIRLKFCVLMIHTHK